MKLVLNEPCPFCESVKICEAGQDGWWQMLCEDCHAAGPSAGNDEDARRYWNEAAIRVQHEGVVRQERADRERLATRSRSSAWS